MKIPVSVHRGKQVTHFLKHLLRYAFPNVDLYIITRWQIKANLNTEEGEKKYTRGNVRQIGRECVI